MSIREIQKQMTGDVLLIFRNNQFLGQDILDEENKILALTGFDGSAGKLAITPQKAVLFVDGRYEIQAKQQVDSKIVTVIVEDGTQDFDTWMKDNYAAAKIAYNPWQISALMLQKMQKNLPEAKWLPQPELMPIKRAKAFELPFEYTGETANDKIAKLAENIKRSGVSAALITAADSVSWLTNLRSDALPDSPIVRAMALVTAERDLILLADNLILPAVYRSKRRSLREIKKLLKPFAGKKINADFNKTPAAIVAICQELGITTEDCADFCAISKAEKNAVELQGMINAHIRDGVAMCKFLAWFEKNHKNKTEAEIADKLLYFRKKQALFYSLSFGTIAGSGANAAIIHYQPKKDACALVAENSVLLLDSGGQYFDGTTDITRTIAVGQPSEEMIEKFTIVLKAHIALASQQFPSHTSGMRLDAVCRSVMWRYGLDYKHGTGHGVGCFLNVHEGPQNIGSSGNNYPIKENMVVSIEPGYYQEGKFGIRIENLVYTAPAATADFLKFVPLTFVPIDYRLIDKYILREGEINWLNNYHQTVRKLIGPYLNEKERKWLEKACSPL